MAKKCFIFLTLFLLLYSVFPVLGNDCLKKTMDSQVGVKELTGNNDGKEIAKYLKTVGLSEGYAYCAAFVKWVFLQCNIKTPITAWSPTAYNSKTIVYKDGRFYDEPKIGDVFVIYSLSKKRIVHTGFYYSFYNSKVFMTCEGNTSPSGAVGSKSDIDGHGVYKKLRSYNQTYAITRWIK